MSCAALIYFHFTIACILKRFCTFNPSVIELQCNYGRNTLRQFKEVLEKRPDFQAVSGLGSISYVHAALWQGDNVRVSVIKTKAAEESGILCVFWYSLDQLSNLTVVRAKVGDLKSFRSRNANAYVICPVDNENGIKEETAPLYVGLVHENYLSEGHRILLPVENREMTQHEVFKDGKPEVTKGTRRKNRVVEFTVCVPAMFDYKNAAQLVEKLEMVRLLGAGRVVLYKTSVGENVEKVLRLYTSEWAAGRETMEVIVHSWRLPPTKLHYKGQLGTANDCLHRYGWLSRYMVFNDLDELIIPLKHSSWSQLMAELERLYPGKTAFKIQHSAFNNDHASPAKRFQKEAFQYGSSVLSLTQRDDIIGPYGRTKLIVDPRKIETVGVHNVHKGIGETVIVRPDQALLYHYRWPVRLCKPEVKDYTVVNKFGKRLLARLKFIWSKLEGVSLGWKEPITKNVTRPSCLEQSKYEKDVFLFWPAPRL